MKSGTIQAMKGLIVANGKMDDPDRFTKLVLEADLVIGADGGTRHLKKMGILPHRIIGDLDSIDKNSRQWLDDNQIPIEIHPRDKDAGDTELAVSYAIEQGCTEITLLGATGTRMDHSLANLFLLRTLNSLGVEARIVDDFNEICLVSVEKTFKGEPGDLLSIIPLTDRVQGVSLEGFKFPLADAEIPMGSSLGISNRFLGNSGTVRVRKGILVVTLSRD